ncbi:hypothetical protein GALMADRAFT_228017 [Galerina marginata CBS 339.88]|uniref:Monopolin complex subunit Csm1/Pcs1 C-terminal domain-containing protein n=1 Tax=Galerina marginata (strain CBS 339.88) TaxID=685588 RepID=A0A067T3H9_GALM3|nr:hypothetical protein GALMADRAFT_228017 [Galerina marginata CBS 339.88]
MKQGGGSRKPASRSAGGKPESSGLNGNSKAKANAQNSAAAAKSKGKQKAKAATTERAPNRYPAEDAEAMDVDAIEVPHDEVDGEDMEPEVLEENLVQAINTAARSGRVKPGTGKVVLAQPPSSPRKNEEVAWLKEQLRQAQKHKDDLSQQLKELCQVRLTEPEQLLERMEVQHQAELHARDSLLQDYMSQGSKNDDHGRTGKTVVFELLTRAEVDKETQALQQQVKTLQEALRDRDKRLQKQDEQIKSLEEDVSITKLELKEEIGRGRTLLAQQQRQSAPSSRSRTGWNTLGSSSDPKYGIIIAFYEDLTNVIVPTMKNQPGKYLDKDEWALSCCYTHKDVVNKDAGSTGKSLSFTLRLGWEPAPGVQEPVVDEKQLAQAVHYIPHELEHESPEFVQSLGFLGDNFTFERDQLSLFARTLHDYISGEGGEKADQTASDDDSVQIVE